MRSGHGRAKARTSARESWWVSRSGTRRLTNSGGWPVWLPDGRQIGFRTHRLDGTQQIEVVSPKNDRVTPLGHIHFSGDNEPFDFSPDGKSIIYTNGETFSSEIWLLDTRR
jgi:Tol biopolymer transport system component